MCTYEVTRQHDHYAVYVDGSFYCSADTVTEAMKEVDNLRYQKLKEEMRSGCALYGRATN